jgi:hypothetical protein
LAPFCGLPLYWPAQPITLSAKAGMHRFSWDLRYDPVDRADDLPSGDVEATGGAVSHVSRRQRAVGADGRYTIRLTANGRTTTQPITVHMDPRVKTSPAASSPN